MAGRSKIYLTHLLSHYSNDFLTSWHILVCVIPSGSVELLRLYHYLPVFVYKTRKNGCLWQPIFLHYGYRSYFWNDIFHIVTSFGLCDTIKIVELYRLYHYCQIYQIFSINYESLENMDAPGSQFSCPMGIGGCVYLGPTFGMTIICNYCKAMNMTNTRKS